MNLKLVFNKTAAGEEALVTPGKDGGLSRATRTVLILVDGRSTVAELGAKISSADLVKTALAELEQRGYVVRRASDVSVHVSGAEDGRDGVVPGAFPDAVSATTERSVLPVRENSADRLEKTEKALVESIELFGVKHSGSHDLDWDLGDPDPSPKKSASVAASAMGAVNGATGADLDGPEGLEGVPVLMEVVDPSLAAGGGAFDGRGGRGAAEAAMPDADAEGRAASANDDPEVRKASATAAAGRSGALIRIAERWRAWRARRRAARNEKPGRREPGSGAVRPEAPFRQMPVSAPPQSVHAGRSARLTRRSSGMRKGLITLVLLAVLGVAAFTAFPPLSVYVAEIESAMSASLGRPVKIGSLSASVYPHPGVLLADVVIDGGQGSADGAGNLHIDKLWLEPDVMTLLSPRKDFRRVFVNGMTLVPQTLAALPALLQKVNGRGSQFHINGLHFERITLDVPRLGLSDLQGQADLSDVAGLSALQLHTEDRKLRVSLTPDGQRIAFEAEGTAIRIPALAPVDFNSISVKGVLENGTMEVSAFDFRLFDGAIKGQASVRLAQNDAQEAVQNGAGDAESGKEKGSARGSAGSDGKGKDKARTEAIAVEGSLGFEHVDAAKLGAALGIGNLLEGDLEGKASFSGAAEEWSGILPASTAEGSFTMRGKLNGIDLVEAARRTSGEPVLGGTTNFEQFSGKMRLAAARSRFYGLAMSSGLMHSAGVVDVDAKDALSGRMDLQIRGSVNQMRVPIVLDGTLQSPSARAIRPQRTEPAVSMAPGANVNANDNASSARPAAPGAGRSVERNAGGSAGRAAERNETRDDDDLSASRESGNVVLPSVQPARF